MANHRNGNDSRPPSKPPVIPLGPWCIFKVKSYLHKRRAQHEKESAQDRSSRRTATATVWIAVFAVITVFVSSLQYFSFQGQLGVMQSQLDEMRASRRPWLTVDTAIAGPLNLNPAPMVAIDFVATNIGQSPAIETWINTALFPMKPGGDGVKEMHRRCLAMRKQPHPAEGPPGYVLFPNHKFDKTGTLPGVPQKEWNDYLFSYGHTGFVTLQLAVCGDYRFSFAPEIHSTEMLYVLGTPKQSPHGVTLWLLTTNVAITLDMGKIEKDDLVLTQEPFGTTYAD